MFTMLRIGFIDWVFFGESRKINIIRGVVKVSDDILFDEFCRKIGFSSYPFNFFTAENEKDRQSSLFVSTKLYSPVLESFESGSTLFLTGDRGTGKTSITYDFIRRSDPSFLICQIDNFESLDKRYSETNFYRFILRSIVNEFFKNIVNVRKAQKKLTEDEKILLTYFYINFASDATRGLAKRVAREIQVSPLRGFIQALYNFFRLPLNLVTNFGVRAC